MKTRTYPLGVDLGSARVRIAEVRRDAEGPSLHRLAAIDLEPEAPPATIGMRIASALAELGIVERRCVAAVGEPDAQLHAIAFPPMSARERERAARYEATRFVDYPPAEAVVRTTPLPGRADAHLVGIVRAARLDRTTAILHAAGLRPVAIDHEAFALRRTFPSTETVLDLGRSASRLYAFGEAAPIGSPVDGDAHVFTRAIAEAFAIDDATAERRKRTIGLAGAGERELAAFAQAVGRALLGARNRGLAEADRMILVGNGARLAGLADRLERDTGCSVEVATDLGFARSSYPEDIARASAPDYALAVGLARWSIPEAIAA